MGTTLRHWFPSIASSISSLHSAQLGKWSCCIDIGSGLHLLNR